ncbi:MAG: Ig-like domain-containing protein [Coprobacillus sp.]|nr:Ig-like domain-containing protein [Coprobacillus sp.]
MKKHFYAFALLALIGVGVSSLAGCSSTSATLNITNKEELQQEWRIGDSSRTMEFEITDEGEIQNPSLAIANGELTISSSNTSVIATSGAVLVASGVGDATITASYKGAKDSVNLSILERDKTWTDWEVGNKYALGYDKDGVTYYYDGGVQNYYYGTVSENPDDAVAVLVEASGDGYTLKLDNGCYLGGSFDGYVDFEWTLTTPYVWDYDSELETFVTTNGGTTYALGTTSSYDEITLVDAYATTSYIAHLYTLSENAGVTVTYAPTYKVSDYTSGESYLLGIDQDGSKYYMDGTMNGYYGATVRDPEQAIEFTVTDVEGGVTLSATIDGTTQYVTMAVNDTHYNLVFSETSQVLTYDYFYDTFTVTSGETTLFLGTYGSYTTIGWYNYAYIDDDGEYPIHLYKLGEEPLPEPAQWSVSNKYLLAYEKDGALYYYNGEVQSSYYGDVSTDVTDAVEVLVETCSSGYSLKLDNGYYLGYSHTSNEKGEHNNFEWDHTEPYEWGYDEELNTFTATYEGTTYVMGITSSYDEITMVQPTSSNYIVRLYDIPTLSAPKALKITGKTEVYKDATITLSAVVNSGADNSVSWSSSNTAYATIDQNGVVKGVSQGETTITATSTLNTSLSATYVVTVKEFEEGVIGIFDFSDITANGTQIKNATDLDAYWIGADSLYTGLTDIDSTNTPVYLGAGSGGAFASKTGLLKFGKSGNGGTITFNFANGTEINKVVVSAHGYYEGGNNSGTQYDLLTINDSDYQLSYSGEPADVTAEFQSVVSSLTLSTKDAQSCRGYVFSITIYGSYSA